MGGRTVAFFEDSEGVGRRRGALLRLTATSTTAFAAISLARACAFDASFSSRSFAVDRYCHLATLSFCG